eukprot:scaffold6599_cov166-Ochromonas_danica.AAC.8
MDEMLLEEIKRVHVFLLGMVNAIQHDLSSIANIIDDVPVVSANRTDHDIELSLRILYHKIHQCEDFFKLNHFAISKICKKFEKLPFEPVETSSKAEPTQPSDDTWDDQYGLRERRVSRCHLLKNFTSGEYFFYQFFSAGTLIDKAKEKCVDLYMTKFRRTYSPLAYYELEYIKNNDNNYTGTRFLTALKL